MLHIIYNFSYWSSSIIIKNKIYACITIKYRIILSINPRDNLKFKSTKIKLVANLEKEKD
jgi:hypothetical protein